MDETDRQAAQDASDLREVSKMMESRGWVVCLVSLHAERERIIKLVAGGKQGGASQDHGWEYYQGFLSGFLQATDIFDRLKVKYEDLVEASRREQEDRNG